MYTNADSLLNKRHELESIIREYKPHIIGISEVNPKNLIYPLNESEINIDGYVCFSSISTGRGVVLYIHNSLEAHETSVGDKSYNMYKDAVWCTVKLNNQDKVLVGCIYRSPNCSASEEEPFNKLLVEASTCNTSHKLIFGDFNHPQIDWRNESCAQALDHPANKFLEAVRDSFLFQHVLNSTHSRPGQKANTLDLIFTNEEEMITNLTHNAPLGASQHDILCFQLIVRSVPIISSYVRYRYEKADYDGMKAFLKQADWNDMLCKPSVDECWESFEARLMEARNVFVPQHKQDRGGAQKKPIWMTADVRSRINLKKQQFKQYRRTRSIPDYENYKTARNDVKWELKRAVRDYERKLSREVRKNPKAFYKYVNSKTKTRTGIPPLETGDGNMTESDKEKAEVLNNYFRSVFTREGSDELPSFEARPFTTPLQDMKFDEIKIRQKLEKLKINKSAGPDQIHPRMLKEMSAELQLPLRNMFTRFMTNGEVPSSWKVGNITPIFKKGKKADPSNYRPVSLTSIVCKVMESSIREMILNHLVSNKLLSENQHGFIAGRSCTTQLLEVLDTWSKILEDGDNIDVIYLDFAKAFDTVPHRRLLKKLEGYGVQGRVLIWIREYLSNRRQCVVINGEKSNYREVTSGIPQGSVIGTLLFLLFINDLPDNIVNLIKLFADDTKLFARIQSSQDCDRLQADLTRIQDWTRQWLLSFNTNKCRVLRIGHNPPAATYSMETNDGHVWTLEESVCERDLGILIDNNLKFSQQVDAVTSKANRILGLIRRTLTYLDNATLVLLYKSLVRPHLEYANVVWSISFKKDINKLEGVQRRATRLIPRLRELDYISRLKLLKLPSMAFRRTRGDMIEVYKRCHGLYQTGQLLVKSKEPRTRGHSLKLHLESCTTRVRHDFFSQRVVSLWNSLPNDVVTATSVNSFKNQLDNHWRSFMYDLDFSYKNRSAKVL